ncbi:hypothetical protein WJX73_008052 [Symbiochloris irregularis]|uniref:Inosine/uridine-preferring nucleoside hydrolase domain-containing protein n=1 Tax=Symbiochloris irregularis TaxID=706552 RepID=A0AAW1NRT5_9CHLO
MQATQRTKLWLDCDAGVDDAQGILLALAQGVQLEGISAVHGNTNVTQVTHNIARILALRGRLDIPVYVGAGEPLLAVAADPCLFHGSDGLGDLPDQPPTFDSLDFHPTPGAAALKLVEAAEQAQGELIIAAVGPLTNIALACKLDPELPSKIRRLVVMGGSSGTGNVTPCAEFNFHADPEAARLVLQKFTEVHLVSWTCAQHHSVSWKQVDEWAKVDTAKGRFMGAVMEGSFGHFRDKDPDGYPPCDPLAVAIAVCPEIVEQSCEVHCDVETQGLARGQSIFDWNAVLKQPQNVSLIQQIDVSKFSAMMLQMLE